MVPRCATRKAEDTGMAGHSQEEYVRHVLDAYRQTPGTTGTVRRPDRMLAAQLYERGVSVTVVENALTLGRRGA